MADNIAVTPGTGASVAADDISGVLYQRVKLVHGADGTNDGDVANANPFPVKTPGAVHINNALTVTAGAYTTGQVVGGKLSFANAARVSGGSGVVQSVIVTVKTALTAAYDLLLFDTDPSNGTYTDNGTFALNTTDAPFCIGVVPIVVNVSGGTPQLMCAFNVAQSFKLNSGTTLYGILVMRGGQTFATIDAVTVSLGILQF